MKTKDSLSSKEPLVSIVMPVYKVEEFLRRAVDSVLCQSYENWELILVDDGSPDGSGAICDAYAKKDERIRVIHQENQGQSVARNTAMALCRGEYLYFIDSDDYIAADTLRILLGHALSKDADIVMHGCCHVKARGTENEADWQYCEDAAEIQDGILIDRLPNFPWGKFYRKSLWGGVAFPTGIVMEDMYIIPVIFFKAKKIVLITDPLYYYCENMGSTMNAVSVDAYVRVRYGKFLAWRAHAEIAEKYRTSLKNVCEAQTMRSALRAYTMASGTEILTRDARDGVKAYLSSSDASSLSFGLRLGRFLVLKGSEGLASLAGSLERRLVSYQQKRRMKRYGYNKK